jgi:hypothetical protein
MNTMIDKRPSKRQNIFRLLQIWLITYITISGWSALNIFIVRTPVILDIFFGVIVCVFIFSRVRKLAALFVRNPIVVYISWLLFIWALLIVMFYPLYGISSLSEKRDIVISPI